MTFDPHPPRVVRPDKAPPLLMTKAQKLEAIAAAGVQGAAIVRFTPELSRWDPETFVRTVLVDWLRVAEVWVGANFLFGHDRAGNFSLLRALGARYGFKAEKIDPVRYKDFVVSSTRIRRLVGEGRVDEAGALLGHQYYIDGTVVHGDGAGATIGFPTANLCTENELLPPHGVYATTATIDGVVQPSVTNIGVRPTVDASGRTTIETHIFNFDEDLYGARHPRRLRPAAARRAGVRVARCAARADRRRLRPGARAVRSPFTVESRSVVRLPSSSSRSTLSHERRLASRCCSSWRRARARPRRLRPDDGAGR